MSTIQRQMIRISVNVPVDAGNACSQVIPVEGDFVYIENVVPVNAAGASINLLPFSVKPDSSPAVSVNYAHHTLRWANPFTSLLIESAGGSTPFTLTIVVGFGFYAENRPLKKDIFSANRTITRLNNATPYAANQVVAKCPDGINNYCEFQNIFKFGSRYSRLTRARIIKSTANLVNANFRLHLFSANSAPVNGVDQLPFQVVYSNADCLLGVINFPLFITGGAGSDAATCDLDGLDLVLTSPAGGYTSIRAQLECLAAYTPGALETIRIDLIGEQL